MLEKWPENGPPVAWTVSGLDGGYSTPSVAGGMIFGMSYRGEDEVVRAIREKDGSECKKIAGLGKAGYKESRHVLNVPAFFVA